MVQKWGDYVPSLGSAHGINGMKPRENDMTSIKKLHSNYRHCIGVKRIKGADISWTVSCHC